MINGYNRLNENIDKTINLISDVETASKEQQQAISQINNAISSLDMQTQQNASIASQTQQVAIETDVIAKLIVEDTDNKELEGKNLSLRKKVSDLTYKGEEKRKIERAIKEYKKT